MSLLPFILAWVIAMVSPGPDFLAVVRTAAAGGRRKGVLAGVGVVAGIACWATLALTGLSLLLARFAHLYLALRLVGSLFLIGYGVYIVVGALRSRGHADGEGTAPAAAPRAAVRHPFRLGLATNLANPKALLFFGALFATVMPPHLAMVAKVALVGGMVLLALGWFALVATLAGSPAVMRGYQRLERRIDAVAGGVFVVIGAALVPR